MRGASACRAEPRKHLLIQQELKSRENPPWAAVARAWHACSVLAREGRELSLKVRLTLNVSADHVPAAEQKTFGGQIWEARFRHAH